MSISTFVIALTLLGFSYALLWHNQTADAIRQSRDNPEGDSTK